MVLDPDAAYLALKARDARFDGRLFVGVTSTGVYCRPVCRVRTPLRRNCRFYATPAQAEADAFRPCLKCRPEIAPGRAAMDSSQALAELAARWIEAAVHEGRPVALPGLAARLGVTDRHLRRIFQAAHGVAPMDYLTTQRLLLAKQLLTDTSQPITQVALASGYDSLRRFNAAFLERYRMSPTRLRHDRDDGRSDGDGAPVPERTCLRLAYRPPYDVEAMLGYFGRRAIAGLESVDSRRIVRSLAIERDGQRLEGWFEARFADGRDELLLTVSPGLAPVLGAVMQRVRHLLDLDADPAPIDAALAGLPGGARPGMRLAGSVDGFETAVRIVLAQQVTVKAARTLIGRLVERHGRPLQTPFPDVVRLFPTAATLAEADPEALGRLGIVRQRVAALRGLAAAVAAGDLVLAPHAPLEASRARLQAIAGIGAWTAEVIAMRALAWPDAWPAADVGLLNALGTRDVAAGLQAAEAWRPWRAYAVMRLWHHLETRPAMALPPASPARPARRRLLETP